MSTLLWVLQIVLAFVMLVSGLAKSFMAKERMLQTGQSGVVDLGLPTIRFIGISELLGVAGVILPWWTGVLPWLTPLAALGFAVIMALAFMVHSRLKARATQPQKIRREMGNQITNVVLLVVALLVVVGRGYGLLAQWTSQ